jgi:predicted NBD/HSP70 family sugar kinase
LETWVSTTGLVAAALEKGHSCLSGLEVIEAADRGERWAVEVCDAAADALGRGLVTLVNIFNPDTVMLTGGLAGARNRLEERAQGILDAQGIGPSVERVELVWGHRAEEYSILGASRNALERQT